MMVGGMMGNEVEYPMWFGAGFQWLKCPTKVSESGACLNECGIIIVPNEILINDAGMN